jgi:hypothetical protein
VGVSTFLLREREGESIRDPFDIGGAFNMQARVNFVFGRGSRIKTSDDTFKDKRYLERFGWNVYANDRVLCMLSIPLVDVHIVIS